MIVQSLDSHPGLVKAQPGGIRLCLNSVYGCEIQISAKIAVASKLLRFPAVEN